MRGFYSMETFISEVSRFFNTNGYAIDKVEKNGATYTGVRLSGEDVKVSAIIYLEHFYVEAMATGLSMEKVADKIKALLVEESKKSAGMTEIIDMLKVWDNAKKYIAYRLYSTEFISDEFLREGFFEEIPGTDLVKMYYICLPREEFPIVNSQDGYASIKINHGWLSTWNKTEEDVKAVAEANTPLLFPPYVKHIDDVLSELIEQIENDNSNTVDLEQMKEEFVNGVPMWIVSTEQHTFGAAAICYPGLLDSIEQILGEVYILPSSVHECIITPVCMSDIDCLMQMVPRVNKTELDASEWLSDHVYKYSKHDGFVMCQAVETEE